jgi:hypothetical protein
VQISEASPANAAHAVVARRVNRLRGLPCCVSAASIQQAPSARLGDMSSYSRRVGRRGCGLKDARVHCLEVGRVSGRRGLRCRCRYAHSSSPACRVVCSSPGSESSTSATLLVGASAGSGHGRPCAERRMHTQGDFTIGLCKRWHMQSRAGRSIAARPPAYRYRCLHEKVARRNLSAEHDRVH